MYGKDENENGYTFSDPRYLLMKMYVCMRSHSTKRHARFVITDIHR